MKKTVLILSVLSTILFGSCSGFLDVKSNNVVSADALTEENLEALISPLYNSVWFNFNNNFIIGIGDGMSYNVDHNADYVGDYSHLTVTALTPSLGDAWNSFYKVVQNANKVIITINSMAADEALKTEGIAEARFMRGLAYWYLTSLWRNVIISDNPTPLVTNPLVNAHRAQDVWEFAIRDLEFAAKYLPETSSGNGRLNRYSAFGMLSRIYLDYAGFKAAGDSGNANVGTRDAVYLDLAKKAAQKVVDSGTFDLMPNFPDLFMIDNNNNVESMFALQWMPGLDGRQENQPTNSTCSFVACHALISGGEAWGTEVEATWNMLQEFTDGTDKDLIRRKATFMGAGDFYPELNKSGGGFRYGWGNDPEKPEYNGGGATPHGRVNVKKGITGNLEDNPAIGPRNSGLNTYMLRYAEVLLNYADATLGNNDNTSDAVALEYFNKVRTRAGMPEKSSITWEDLRRERRVEFCFEGRYWYDLLARSYYRQSEVIDLVNGQNRGTKYALLFEAESAEDGTPLDFDARRNPAEPTLDQERNVGTAGPNTFVLPYPEGELIQNPNLGEAPVAWEFTEERITDLFD